MQAMETERSPGLPSLMVTTRRRFIPHGTSCSFLQAVTQALHSMQRSASQRNFILGMLSALLCRSNLTERRLRLLHTRRRIVAISGDRVDTLADHNWISAMRILSALVDVHKDAGKVERTPGNALRDTFGNDGPHTTDLSVRHLRTYDMDPRSIFDAALSGIRWIDFEKHVLL